MSKKHQSEVLVVGGGPVGLFAALCLAERGVDVELVDRSWRGSVQSYGLALHPESLRMLDALGLTPRLLEQGYRVERVALYQDERRTGALDLTQLSGTFPYVLVIPQSALEQVLHDALKARDIEVLWNHQVMGLHAGSDGVDFDLARMDKVSSGYPIARTDWVVDKTFKGHASIVIGADGYHSSVRTFLGSSMTTLGAPEVYSVFEFPGPTEVAHQSNLVIGSAGASVFWPMGLDRGRWSFRIAKAEEQAPTVQHLHRLIAERAPWFEPVPREIHWSTLTLFDRRVVDRFGSDRIWLAGDAAHLTGPIGVQSMNVGLREASDLAERAAAVVNGNSAPRVLDEYGRRWHAEWNRLLGQTDGLFASGGSTWGDDGGLNLLPCIPASGEDLDQLLKQAGLEFR